LRKELTPSLIFTKVKEPFPQLFQWVDIAVDEFFDNVIFKSVPIWCLTTKLYLYTIDNFYDSLLNE